MGGPRWGRGGRGGGAQRAHLAREGHLAQEGVREEPFFLLARPEAESWLHPDLLCDPTCCVT